MCCYASDFQIEIIVFLSVLYGNSPADLFLYFVCLLSYLEGGGRSAFKTATLNPLLLELTS